MDEWAMSGYKQKQPRGVKSMSSKGLSNDAANGEAMAWVGWQQQFVD